MDTVQLAIWLIILTVSIFVLVKGADYFVEGAKEVGRAFGMSPFAIGVVIVGVGTSLPELFVSLQAVKRKETDIALGNIFGSNAFNILMVVGIPGLITPLVVDDVVMQLGIWVMVAASLILFINGLARQVQRWEGVAMLLFFVFFLAKLVQFV
jgi:cation:H+ antiporter